MSRTASSNHNVRCVDHPTLRQASGRSQGSSWDDSSAPFAPKRFDLGPEWSQKPGVLGLAVPEAMGLGMMLAPNRRLWRRTQARVPRCPVNTAKTKNGSALPRPTVELLGPGLPPLTQGFAANPPTPGALNKHRRQGAHWPSQITKLRLKERVERDDVLDIRGLVWRDCATLAHE